MILYAWYFWFCFTHFLKDFEGDMAHSTDRTLLCHKISIQYIMLSLFYKCNI